MDEYSKDNLKDDHIEGILLRAELLLNDTFQPRKLGSLSQACNTALNDQKKSMMRKAADLIVEEDPLNAKKYNRRKRHLCRQ